MSLLALSWLACASNGCLDRDLADWCHHDEEAQGPTESGGCPLDPRPDEGTIRCGDYDVEIASGGFTSTSWYYDHRSGALVAVAYGTDTDSYCGSFTYWYGQRVDCEP